MEGLKDDCPSFNGCVFFGVANTIDFNAALIEQGDDSALVG